MTATPNSVSRAIFVEWQAACQKTAATYAHKLAALRAYRDRTHPTVQAAQAAHASAISAAHSIEARSPESIAHFIAEDMRAAGHTTEGGQ